MKGMFSARWWVPSLALLMASPCWSQAQLAQPGQVVIAGAVPDEATRVALVAKLKEVYGSERVSDQLTVGGVVMPSQWSASMQRLISSDLKSISRGEIRVEGTQVTVRGETVNEVVRQDVVSNMATVLPATYTVKNALRVASADQHVLDATLNNRIVEFESGSAVLTATGQAVLDDMAAALQRLQGRRVEVIGHTDSLGERDANLVLSQARADTVRNYFLRAGIAAEAITTSAAGPDRPVASNGTEQGRARNRRIEFRLQDGTAR